MRLTIPSSLRTINTILAAFEGSYIMASKKRRRAALSANDVQTSEAASPHIYYALPLEIRQLIVEMACLSPSSSTPFRSPFPTDVDTILTLCLVCKETHAQATDLLWQTISITRPSALFAFYQALLLRPERASLVSSLHIGPQDTLPSYWWPLSSVEYYKGSRTPLTPSEAGSPYRSIASSLGREQLPIGCTDRQAWLWDRCPSPCREAAVYEALDVVQKSLDVTLRQEVARPTKIESVFEAQAALDIYLDRLRYIEKSDPELLRLNQPGARVPLRCRNGKCEHYPALHLVDVPSSVAPPTTSTSSSVAPPTTSTSVGSSAPPAEEPPENAFIVPHSQLLRHLARQGALTDRFDHPLLLARSGFTIHVTQSALKGPNKLMSSNASYSLESKTWSIEREHETQKWQGALDSLHNAPQHFTGSGDVGDLNAALFATANVGAILCLAREVLDLLPSLVNLSLTGFLQNAVVRGDSFERMRSNYIEPLPNLRKVSIGPTLPCWAASLPLGHLMHVEELRICGSPLPINEAWAITSRMPNLKVLTWSLANEFQNIRGKR